MYHVLACPITSSACACFESARCIAVPSVYFGRFAASQMRAKIMLDAEKLVIQQICGLYPGY